MAYVLKSPVSYTSHPRKKKSLHRSGESGGLSAPKVLDHEKEDLILPVRWVKQLTSSGTP